jgi:hypothetical protein
MKGVTGRRPFEAKNEISLRNERVNPFFLIPAAEDGGRSDGKIREKRDSQ